MAYNLLSEFRETRKDRERPVVGKKSFVARFKKRKDPSNFQFIRKDTMSNRQIDDVR